MHAKDFYAILGVSPDADAEVIEAAYRALALKHHPDRSDATDANRRMAEINEAHEVLRDPVRRAAYDAQRHRARSTERQSPRANGNAAAGNASSAAHGTDAHGYQSDSARQRNSAEEHASDGRRQSPAQTSRRGAEPLVTGFVRLGIVCGAVDFVVFLFVVFRWVPASWQSAEYTEFNALALLLPPFAAVTCFSFVALVGVLWQRMMRSRFLPFLLSGIVGSLAYDGLFLWNLIRSQLAGSRVWHAIEVLLDINGFMFGNVAVFSLTSLLVLTLVLTVTWVLRGFGLRRGLTFRDALLAFSTELFNIRWLSSRCR